MNGNFKRRLAQGETVSLINPDHSHAGFVSFLGQLGIDAIMLDCEQGTPGFDDIENMTRSAHLRGVASIVRVSDAQPWTIERHMMRGVDGIVIPRLDTAEQAAQAVAAVHYAVPARREDLTIIVQIETMDAVNELDQFLSVPGIDCLFIGAVDLAKSMGHAGDYAHPDVHKTLLRTIATIREAGKAVGFLVKPGDLNFWQSQGVTMLYGHANDFLRLGAEKWRGLAGLS